MMDIYGINKIVVTVSQADTYLQKHQGVQVKYAGFLYANHTPRKSLKNKRIGVKDKKN